MRLSNKENTANEINILIIDDEQAILDTLKALICDYNCITTTNSEKAINIIKTNNPKIDMLIIDYLMIGYTASDVINQIRSFNNEIYIILLTGFAQNIPALYAMKNLGIDSYSIKSTDFTDLLLKIEIGIKTIKKYTPDKTDQNLEFCEKIKQLRIQNQMTQEEIANYIGVGRTTVVNYERGRIKPTIENIKKLAELFKVSIDYLLD